MKISVERNQLKSGRITKGVVHNTKLKEAKEGRGAVGDWGGLRRLKEVRLRRLGAIGAGLEDVDLDEEDGRHNEGDEDDHANNDADNHANRGAGLRPRRDVDGVAAVGGVGVAAGSARAIDTVANPEEGDEEDAKRKMEGK